MDLIHLSLYYRRFFPESWEFYYQQALNIADKCWNKVEQAQIYLRAGQSYFDEQENTLATEALSKAFELDPNHWRIIVVYLNRFKSSLSEKGRFSLIQRMSHSSQDAMTYFVQAREYQDLGWETDKEKYLCLAIEAYENALKQGLSRETHKVPSFVAEEAIAKIKAKLDES